MARRGRTAGFVDERIAHWARATPDAEAVSYLGRTFTWSQWDDRVRRNAGGLQALGVGRGDVVAFLDKNHPGCVETSLGAGSLGAANAIINFRLAGDEIDYAVNDSGCTVVLKPAPDTPWSATHLGKLIAEKTDIPPGVISIVASSDHLVRAWHETYGLPVVLTNCSNNYGPFHFPEKLIPVVILNAIAGKPLPIYGKGENIRDWLYVEDHAEALLLVVQKGELGRNYNIGGENERTNLELVKTLCAILDDKLPKDSGSYADQITFVTDRPGHDARYAIDPNRIRKELGWRPSVTVEEGLKKTVQWYLDNEGWWRPLQERHGVGQRLGVKA